MSLTEVLKRYAHHPVRMYEVRTLVLAALALHRYPLRDADDLVCTLVTSEDAHVLILHAADGSVITTLKVPKED